MKSLLQSYHGIVTAVSPIHIGNGMTYNEKEFILLQAKRPLVIIPDMRKLYAHICSLGYSADFEDFMLDSEQKDLSSWLKAHKVTKDFYRTVGAYSLSNLDSNVKLNEINSFIKDGGTGLPYIPGSSIKGMLRTCLMIWEIAKNRKSTIIPQINSIAEALPRADKNYLRNEIKNIESQIFNTLARNKKKYEDMVNSCLAGLIVGDSKCFDYKQLTLAQVSSLNLNGQDKKLSFKECLIPGTRIDFTLTLDRSLCPYSIEDIKESIDFSAKLVFSRFYTKFKVMPINSSGIFWLGGNTGFSSKTILQALFDEKEAINKTDAVFKHTLGQKIYKMHGHNRDVQIGIAPHTCRCCSYFGKLYDVGRCRVEFKS